MENKKPGAPAGAQNAMKGDRPFDAKFPVSMNYVEQKNKAVDICNGRKIKLSHFVREAIDEKIARES